MKKLLFASLLILITISMNIHTALAKIGDCATEQITVTAKEATFIAAKAAYNDCLADTAKSATTTTDQTTNVAGTGSGDSGTTGTTATNTPPSVSTGTAADTPLPVTTATAVGTIPPPTPTAIPSTTTTSPTISGTTNPETTYKLYVKVNGLASGNTLVIGNTENTTGTDLIISNNGNSPFPESAEYSLYVKTQPLLDNQNCVFTDHPEDVIKITTSDQYVNVQCDERPIGPPFFITEDSGCVGEQSNNNVCTVIPNISTNGRENEVWTGHCETRVVNEDEGTTISGCLANRQYEVCGDGILEGDEKCESEQGQCPSDTTCQDCSSCQPIETITPTDTPDEPTSLE